MSSSDVGFYSRYVRNDVTLCKLEVNVKNRTAGSVGFFKLGQLSFKEKVLLYINFNFENQMW